MLYDVKLSRPHSTVIIAGPYDSIEEAQMHATRLGLDFQKWKKEIYTELAEVPGDDIDREIEKRRLDKFVADNETVYEVVPHVRGGL